MERDFCILIHTVRVQTTVSLYSSSLDSYRNRESFYHVIIPSAQWSWRWVYWFHLVRPSVSALFSMLFSALWLGCGELWMRKYSPRYGWNADIMWKFLRIPVRILPSAFSPHFFPYKNAEISPRSCPNTPIRIFSARKMRRSGVREWKLAPSCTKYTIDNMKKKRHELVVCNWHATACTSLETITFSFRFGTIPD